MPAKVMTIQTNTSYEKRVEFDLAMHKPISDWEITLQKECCVYLCNNNGSYLAKKLCDINYIRCSEDIAAKIFEHNASILLKYKYFPFVTDDAISRIHQIITSILQHLDSVLLVANIDNADPDAPFKQLYNGCVAFNNCVFDFFNNKILFSYTFETFPTGYTAIYYDNTYIINWHFNFDFIPLEYINLQSYMSPAHIVNICEQQNAINPNMCFQLIYNMSHDSSHHFDISRFQHICEILGYLCEQSFEQHFVMLVGSGQNGKNSLFDSCFTNFVKPTPASVDLNSIENDRFITGTLESVSHNIFLESSATSYSKSKMIKALTGSPFQSIENKGMNRYSGYINCKYVFAANDKQNLKFTDSTLGFLRRVNVLELFYTWDAAGEYLTRGDYYECNFSNDLHELSNTYCATLFIYLAMFGLSLATNKGNKQFTFTFNDWTADYIKYSDTSISIQQQLSNISIRSLLSWARSNRENTELFDMGMLSSDDQKIWKSIIDDTNTRVMFDTASKFLQSTYTVMEFDDEQQPTTFIDFMAAKYLYNVSCLWISCKLLKYFLNRPESAKAFTSLLKTTYPNAIFQRKWSLTYIRAYISNGMITIY